jgi:hypothetical protein
MLRTMSPTTIVILVSVVAFVFAMAGFAVFGPPLEERKPISTLDWLVRGLVSLALVHTVLGAYTAAVRMQDFGDGPRSERAAYLADSVMSIIAFGGVLLALAGLLHVLLMRSRSR